MNQDDMNTPRWLFHKLIENKFRKFCNPKPLKQIARDNFETDHKQLNRKLGEKINSYYFSDRSLQVGFNVTLDSHLINHAIFEKTINPKY